MPKYEIMNNSIPRADIEIKRDLVFSYPTHTHSHYEMTLYEPFDGGITVNGELFKVDVPSVFLISPSDFHRITVNEAFGDSLFIKVGFYEKSIRSIGSALPDRPLILRNVDRYPLITELFNEITKNTDDTAYVSILIETAMRCVIKYGMTVQSATLGKKHELAVNVLRYANKNFSSDMTLLDTAKRFCVSPQYLSSVFTYEVGTGFSTYITDLRLKKAAELLNDSNKNITEVCFECGYRNLSHFLRSFKQKYGLTPKEYRKRTYN